MFFDWLTIEQDFGFDLPIVSDSACQYLSIDSGQLTGEVSCIYQQPFRHEGSFCDSLYFRIRGSFLSVSGNPSRWGRVENLFGLPTVDSCVSVFNGILFGLGLPVFTKCSKIFYRQNVDGSKISSVSDGAIIKELHITFNKSVGFDNVTHYISALSTLPYRNSVPRLHSNGRSVDWLSKLGNVNLIYPCVYDKANELELHSNKIKNRFGSESVQFKFIKRVINYCKDYGVVRFEQKLKSRYLQKKRLQYWGLSDYSVLSELCENFISLDNKISVTGMDIENISDALLSKNVVDSVKSANITALYALEWFHGKNFDLSKRSVQTHRSRLRKIGIDIAQKCNISKFSPIIVKNIRQINVVDLPVPDWYQRINHLSNVA